MADPAPSRFEPADPDFDSRLRAAMAASPVFAFYGFEVVSLAPGAAELALDARPQLGHRPGFFQGTIQGALADYAGSFAAYTLIAQDWRRLTLDYTIKFLGPAQGQRLIGRAMVQSAGRTISVSRVDVLVLRDGVERLCATALVTTSHTPPPD